MHRRLLRCRVLPFAVVALALSTRVGALQAQQQVQCFPIEFFYDSEADETAEIRAAFEQFAAERTGLKLHLRDVHDDEAARKRLDQIGTYFRMSEVKLPAVYGLKYILADIKSPDELRSRLDQALTLTAYIRNGCPHCRAAKAFLDKYAPRYPALKIVYREVVTDRAANEEMQQLTRRHRQRAASLPVVHYCNGLTIGFDRESTTGRKVLQTLDYWSTACTVEKKN